VGDGVVVALVLHVVVDVDLDRLDIDEVVGVGSGLRAGLSSCSKAWRRLPGSCLRVKLKSGVRT